MAGWDETPPPSWQEIAEAMASQRDQASRSYERERDRADSLMHDVKRLKAVVDELLPRFDGLVDAITALIPDDYDSDEAVESIILRWTKDVLADRADVEKERDALVVQVERDDVTIGALGVELRDLRAQSGMPVFVIKAKDALALHAVGAYRELCRTHYLNDQADEVQKAMDEIFAWQITHEDQVKLPDHKHVPVVRDA